MTLLLRSRDAVAQFRKALAGSTVGWVPTMGALHAGHTELVRSSLRQCRVTIVGIYVNPLQFAPNEDFDTYPRKEAHDVQILTHLGADAVFLPGDGDVFPAGRETISTSVDVPLVTRRLCGRHRPGHFQGMLLEVLAQVLVVQPTHIFLGEKDYQQLVAITAMIRDVGLPSKVCPVPVVRDVDGLAFSSRNEALSGEQRRIAVHLYKVLIATRTSILLGTPIATAVATGRDQLLLGGFTAVDYLSLVDAACDEIAAAPARPTDARIVAAVKVGATRLIDNVPVTLPARDPAS